MGKKRIGGRVHDYTSNKHNNIVILMIIVTVIASRMCR